MVYKAGSLEQGTGSSNCQDRGNRFASEKLNPGSLWGRGGGPVLTLGPPLLGPRIWVLARLSGQDQFPLKPPK